ncbi:rRNA pseudouridine synthase [Nicoliella spurrieriana]|uniref:Pseudouridine synthase n=1 Tax=Nicoliella spurrieriana TaxID=2925830 RepID=A0A976RRN8_9LACO|nr:pseudouridine synthase [Nicoliella spurrieriana]UQS86558.1 rRNA pseudouridine synthase [Nicoliella spurrieriana]
MAERLQKVMARAGVASRRKSEAIIKAGRVRVNGQVVTELGIKVKSSDEIQVDRVPISKEQPVYYLFYKPRQVVSTVSDEKNRKTVMDYFPEVSERIYPVGRLDYDTAGLLLMTNDGDLDNRLTHPKYEINKVYVAKVTGMPSNDGMKKLRLGVMIDGKKTAPAKTKVLEAANGYQVKNAVIQLTIHEGRNHEVKKMFEAIGNPVKKLSRVQYGFLTLGNLKPGEYRPLKKVEVDRLREMTDK